MCFFYIKLYFIGNLYNELKFQKKRNTSQPDGIWTLYNLKIFD